MDKPEKDIDLLGILIHDMGNALRIAVMRTHEAANESHPSRANQKASLAYAACRDAEAILKRARFLWEMKTKSQLPNKELVSLRTLANTISEIADILAKVTSKKNSFVLDIQALSSASNLSFEANLEAIAQAVWSIAENAFLYSFAGERIVIKASIRQSRELIISVTNRGVEIRPEEIDRCTQLGWRGRSAKLVNSGHGLGLWVVARIMESHSGSFQLSSAKGITTATLIIPLNQSRDGQQ